MRLRRFNQLQRYAQLNNATYAQNPNAGTFNNPYNPAYPNNYGYQPPVYNNYDQTNQQGYQTQTNQNI